MTDPHRKITRKPYGDHGGTGRFVERRRQDANVVEAAYQTALRRVGGDPKAARRELAIAEERVYTSKPNNAARESAERWGF